MDHQKKKVADLREDYRAKSLDITDIVSNPINQFDLWFKEALNAELKEPNAMTLATADKSGSPSARIVLLKGYDEKGFVFYTNYNSRKGKELKENPNAALVFCWLDLERQIRIHGRVEIMSAIESEAYFQSRPRKSQIGAYASPQSTVITNRNILEKNVVQLEEKYKGVDQLPKPAHWGGYRVIPHSIEFWQGRSSRLHDRIRYTKEKESWKIERLAP